MVLQWVAVAFAAAWVALALHGRLSRFGRLMHKIPAGPGEVPIIGHVGATTPGTMAQYIAKAVHEVNPEGGVLRFRFLNFQFLSICSPAALHELLKQHSFVPKPRLLHAAMSTLGGTAPSVLQMEDEEEHRRLRKHMNAFFNPANVDSVYKTLRDAVLAMAQGLANDSADGGMRPQSINAETMTHELINTVVMEVFFESQTRVDMATFLDAQHHGGHLMLQPFNRLLMNLGLTAERRRYDHNWHTLRRTWKTLMEEMYARDLREDSTAFWACLVRAFPDAMTDAAQFESAVANVALVYAAGTETTASAIAMTLAVLAADPPSMDALVQELQGAGLMATSGKAAPPPPTPDALRNLPFLDAVVHQWTRAFNTRVLRRACTVS